VFKQISFAEFMENLDFFVKEAKSWKIFIYPTDTIYGIGWVWNKANIKKIANIKNREWNKMFSVIAPNFEWIEKNYKTQINSMNQFSNTLDILNWSKIWEKLLSDQLEKYHWVTWIFDYNKPGVRILKHEIQNFIEKLWEAFITTSVNIAWENSVTNLDTLNPKIKEKVDYIIDFGICEWKPSVLLDFVGDKVIKR
jgi:tRNA A37 threonylcarbamoyladenosine synthetase subunit TsaC/SUA5/YrdC